MQPAALLLDVDAGTFPPVPVAPTRDDAEAALGTLLRPLQGFPFVNAAAFRRYKYTCLTSA